METFGDLLKQCINSQGLTIYGLAKETGINRSFLQGVLSGAKKLPQKRFNDIINQRFFTAEQVAMLCDKFFADKIVPKEMERINYIEKGICGYYRNELLKEDSYGDIEIIPHTLYTGRDRVLALINTVMHCGELNYFASNFKFADIEINRIVFNVCRKRKIEHFFHYLSRNEENDMLDLEEVFYTIHYAEIGYLTDKHYAQRGVDILPLFILTDKYMIKFDENAENAFVFDAEIIKDFMEEKLIGVKRKCRRHVYHPESAIEMMRLMDTTLSENADTDTIGFDNATCPSYLTPEIANDIASDYVKQNPAIIAGLFAHYKLMLGSALDVESEESNKIKIIATHESVINFTDTGRMDTLPLSLASPVKKEHRAQMLAGMCATPNAEYRLTNSMFFKTDFPFAFQIQNKVLSITTAKYPFDLNDPEQYIGNVLYISEDEQIISAFLNFWEYFSKTEKVHSLPASQQLLKAHIDALNG